MKLVFCFLIGVVLLFYSANSRAQINIVSEGGMFIDLNIGATTSGVLPNGVKLGQSNSVNTIPPYPTGTGDTTQYLAGDNMPANSPAGIYNFGWGSPLNPTDRGIGFLASATGLKTGVIYFHFRNTSGGPFNTISTWFDSFLFKEGTNPAGFKLSLYKSYTGTNWTLVGYENEYSQDASNNGFSPAPDPNRVLSNDQGDFISLPNNADIYFAIVYTVTSGTNTANAQALAVKFFYISPFFDPGLPIVLKSFDAKYQKNKVNIQWTTVTEINNDKFLVEKSIDGQQFELVAEVPGGGNSKELNAYEVIDPNPFKGTSYYRLTQIDFDGKSQKFAPVAVRADVQKMSVETLSDKLLRIYSPSKGEASILIHDVSGRIIFSEKIMLEEGYQHYQLSSSLFLNGLYTIQVLNDKEIVVKKMCF